MGRSFQARIKLFSRVKMSLPTRQRQPARQPAIWTGLFAASLVDTPAALKIASIILA
jgi:hypothetical protein